MLQAELKQSCPESLSRMFCWNTSVKKKFLKPKTAFAAKFSSNLQVFLSTTCNATFKLMQNFKTVSSLELISK